MRQVFGIDIDMEVPAFSERDPHVPELDPDYLFDRPTTLAILAGFAHNRRVMVTGYHGTAIDPCGESPPAQLAVHPHQFDSHISRIDLIGKDAIVVKDGVQVTESVTASCPGRSAQRRAGLRRI